MGSVSLLAIEQFSAHFSREFFAGRFSTLGAKRSLLLLLVQGEKVSKSRAPLEQRIHAISCSILMKTAEQYKKSLFSK